MCATGWSRIGRLFNFDPLNDPNPSTIKALQICSALKGHYNERKFHDNTHCVTIVDGKLFDPNNFTPIQLNEKNLNLCCVGGNKWVFHHVSITYEYIPGKLFKKQMKRKMSSIHDNKHKRVR